MAAAPKLCNEAERLEALYRYRILDTPFEEDFDNITELAAYICQAPIAVVNLIDRDRQWFKSEIGLGVRETSLDTSICAHAILQPGLFIVPDTLKDERFHDNPLVTGNPHLRFYAGALLESSDGYPIGTLCVLDYAPRELSLEQKKALLALSRQVMAQLELRRQAGAIKALNERLQRSMTESHHRIKNSLQVLCALVDMQVNSGEATVSLSELQRISRHIRALAVVHDLLTQESKTDANSERISAKAALAGLLPVLQTMLSRQHIHADVEAVPLSIKQASSLTLLVNELVSNAVKHAGEGDIDIALTATADTVRLEVSDYGKGFPEDFDPASAANTGLALVESLGRWDLRGEIAYGNRSYGTGGRVVITFPRPDLLPAPEVSS